MYNILIIKFDVIKRERERDSIWDTQERRERTHNRDVERKQAAHLVMIIFWIMFTLYLKVIAFEEKEGEKEKERLYDK